MIEAKPYETATSKLRRTAITKASKWSMNYRITKDGSWSFKYHPWTREMVDENGDWCGKKAAQMGFTEVCLNRAFFSIDILKTSVLYILPSKTPDATDFSADRFDSALEMSPHLSDMFSNVKNVGHKRAGSVSLYLRGARSRSGLKSIPAGIIIFDEFDEMLKSMVILAEERSSGQSYSQDIRISTPTLPGIKIDEEYENSSKEIFTFKCPHCSRRVHLDHENCLVVCGDSVTDPDIRKTYIQCPECKVPIPHERKHHYFADGVWVPSRSDYIKRGFHVPQHYSCSLEPWKIARLAMLAEYDPKAEAELWNSKYGLAKETKGARVKDDDYFKCFVDRKSGEYPTIISGIVMGIDVGSYFNVVIKSFHVSNWDGRVETFNSSCLVDTILVTKVKHIHEVDDLIKRWRPVNFCIDANPEVRIAQELCSKYPKIGYRVQYSKNTSKEFNGINDDFILAGRTYWLDMTLGRYRQPGKLITLPKDITSEHKEHIQNIIKHYSRDNSENEYVANYLNVGPDHYGHAENYSEIAIRCTLFASHGVPSNISEDIF